MPTHWESRFNGHPLWQLVDQVDEVLRPLSPPTDPRLKDSIDRIKWLLATLKAHREAGDPRSYTPSMLKNLRVHMQNAILGPLNQYATNPQSFAQYLQQAGDAVDVVLDQMAAWPVLMPRAQMRSAAALYNKAAEQLRAEEEEWKATLDALFARVGELDQQIASEIASLGKAREEFEETAAQKVQEHLDDVTSTYLKDASDRLDEIKQLASTVETEHAELEDLIGRSRRLLAAAAERAVANDYRKLARNKAIAAWIWDITALMFGAIPLTLVLMHMYSFDPDPQGGLSLNLTRIGVAIAGFGLAGICVRRATYNHMESRRAKRADLRLTTVRPFTANHDPQFRQALLEGMAERVFLFGLLDEGKDDDYDASLMASLLDRVRRRNTVEDSPSDE